MAAHSYAFTIRRAAEILGEDEKLLSDMAASMGPQHGRLSIHDTDNQSIAAFTSVGMEYLREMISEYKRNRSSSRS